MRLLKPYLVAEELNGRKSRKGISITLQVAMEYETVNTIPFITGKENNAIPTQITVFVITILASFRGCFSLY